MRKIPIKVFFTGIFFSLSMQSLSHLLLPLQNSGPRVMVEPFFFTDSGGESEKDWGGVNVCVWMQRSKLVVLWLGVGGCGMLVVGFGVDVQSSRGRREDCRQIKSLEPSSFFLFFLGGRN